MISEDYDFNFLEKKNYLGQKALGQHSSCL